MCDKKHFILDANVFYSLMGRDTLFNDTTRKADDLKVQAALNTAKHLYLPSSVFTEILIHFRNDLNRIQDIFYFITEKNIKIAPIGVKAYSTDELHRFWGLDVKGKNAYLKSELDQKIGVEVSFAYTFLYSLAISYSGYLARTSNINEGAVMNVYGKHIKDTFMNFDIQELTKQANLGYANNKELQYIKKCFIEMLDRNCALAHGLILNLTRNGNPTEEEIDKLTTELFGKGIGSYPDNIMGEINKISTDVDFNNLVKDTIPNAFAIKKYSQIQVGYLKMKYQSWIDRSQKFRKNDVYDMLFLGAYSEDFKENINKTYHVNINLNDIILVSLDRDILSYIQTFSTESFIFCNTLPPCN